MLNTRTEEKNTVFYSYLACCVKSSTGHTHTQQQTNHSPLTRHTNTERATAQRQRRLIVEVVVAPPKLPPSAALLLSRIHAQWICSYPCHIQVEPGGIRYHIHPRWRHRNTCTSIQHVGPRKCLPLGRGRFNPAEGEVEAPLRKDAFAHYCHDQYCILCGIQKGWSEEGANMTHWSCNSIAIVWAMQEGWW